MALYGYMDKGKIWWALFRGGGWGSWEWRLILHRKITSTCILLNLLLFFLFSNIKLLFLHLLCRAKMWNMFEVTNKGSRICKVKDKVNNRHRWGHSGLFIVNFEHIPLFVTVFLLLTLISYFLAGIVAYCSEILCLLESM